MLYVDPSCKEYLEETKRAAHVMGPTAEAQLKAQLLYLGTYACNEEDPQRTVCLLYRDFAPFSFSFRMRVRNKAKGEDYRDWFSGGLIYSGPGLFGCHAARSDGGFPSLSVSLDPEAVNGSKHMWCVHT